MSSSSSTRPARVSPIRLVLGEAAFVLLLGLLLFMPAGTTHWPRAWVLLGVLALSRIAGLARLYRLSPALLAERAKGPLQRGQPLADKLLLPAFMASYAGLIAFTAADCFRLDLLGRTSALAAGAGLVGVVAGSVLVFAALTENAYATMVVRHQAEREQRVIDGGVYGWVRHPMYAGGALMQLGIPLWLGSVAGVVGSIVPIGILVVRIAHEERMLTRTLEGYGAYRASVRSRLVPGIW